MNFDSELKCPKCGGTIEYDEIYDNENGENYVIDYCVGHCANCGTIFQWQEEFTKIFDGVKNFEEVS